MVKQLTLWSVMIAMLGLTVPAFAQEDTDTDRSPERVAQKCVAHAKRVAERCAERNGAIARRTIAQVERLLEAGHIGRAHHAARHGIAAINHNSDHCVRKIRQHCARCVRWLNKHGYEELAKRVKTACRGAIRDVRANQERAVEAIKSVFD